MHKAFYLVALVRESSETDFHLSGVVFRYVLISRIFIVIARGEGAGDKYLTVSKAAA